MFFKAVGLVLSKIIAVIAAAIGLLVSLLPPSPFQLMDTSGFGDLIAQVNYFIPINEFVVITEAWLVAVGVYYVYSIFARWLKAIH